MAASSLPPPPTSSPVAENGLFSTTWSRWLQQLQTMLSGAPTVAGWLPASGFANSWAAIGGHAARYRKNPFGEVRLGGAMTGGTNDAEAFQLPAGFRPDSMTQAACFTWDGAALQPGRIKIDTDGKVCPLSATNVEVWLDGVTFQAAQ